MAAAPAFAANGHVCAGNPFAKKGVQIINPTERTATFIASIVVARPPNYIVTNALSGDGVIVSRPDATTIRRALLRKQNASWWNAWQPSIRRHLLRNIATLRVTQCPIEI